jgi:putative flippase GtrA
MVWWKLPRELRFVLAGAYNTAFGYGLFAALFLLLGTRVHYLAISILCQVVSLTSAFIVYRRWVFKSRERWHLSFIRFTFSQLLAIAFGTLGLYALVRFGHLAPLFAQALVIAAAVFLSYLLHRYFSFRDGLDVGGVP